MNKTIQLLAVVAVLLPFTATAQKSDITSAAQKASGAAKFDTTKKWEIGGPLSVTFTQTSLSNWAGGGESSVGLTALASLHANYSDLKFSWLNDLELGYGFTRLQDQPLQKTTDQIEATSSVGYILFDHTSVTFLTNFQSQFASGYTNAADTVLMSKFMSPGYLIISLGLDYKPNKDLSLFLSPASGRFVFVEDQALANLGDDGVTPAVEDNYGHIIIPGKKEKTEFGAYFKGNYDHTFNKNVNFTTELELFSNYLKDPQNIVVNWSTYLQLKFSKYLAVTFNTQLIYDNTIDVPIYKKVNGVSTLVGSGPRLQFKDVLGVGLGFKI